MAEVVLVNDKTYLDDFIRLNEAWISRYFKLEAPDFALARNPARIIDDGGFVFTLLADNQVAGVCALFRESAQVFQLARMAVDVTCLGKGYGHHLMATAIQKLEEIHATRVFLLSNTKLTAAIALYRKHGFTVMNEEQHPVYARCNIMMERMV